MKNSGKLFRNNSIVIFETVVYRIYQKIFSKKYFRSSEESINSNISRPSNSHCPLVNIKDNRRLSGYYNL